MNDMSAELPNDIETLKSLLISTQKSLTDTRQENHRLQQLITLYEEERRLAKAHSFGPSSEQESIQYYLFDEAESSVEDEDKTEQATPVKAHQRRGGRRPLPDYLPRIEIIHDLSEAEKRCGCGCEKQQIGEVSTEQLDIIPAKVRVLKHIRYKYTCRSCDSAPETASLPAQLLPKSQVSAGFMAYVVTGKFADALPLYRQCHMLNRSGIEVHRHTLCQQVIKTGERTQALINLLMDHTLGYSIVQMDETPLQVLNEAGKRAQSKCYMWVMHGGSPDKPSVIYHYDPGRGQAVVKRLLEGYQGYLQSDGWHAYEAVHSNEIIGVACWAHARRKFKEAEKANKTKSTRIRHAVNIIKELYKIEREHRASSVEQRYQARQTQSLPILTDFKDWLESQSVNPQSRLGMAIQYTLKLWSQLIRYCEDGRLNIDNNAVENKIRPFAVGRKNWLFSASQAGAKASANLYSLIETAKANGLNEYDYLKWVFTKLTQAQSVEDFESLLPWNIDKPQLVNWVYA